MVVDVETNEVCQPYSRVSTRILEAAMLDPENYSKICCKKCQSTTIVTAVKPSLSGKYVGLKCTNKACRLQFTVGKKKNARNELTEEQQQVIDALKKAYPKAKNIETFVIESHNPQEVLRWATGDTLSYNEAAKVLGISPQNARIWAIEAREKLGTTYTDSAVRLRRHTNGSMILFRQVGVTPAEMELMKKRLELNKTTCGFNTGKKVQQKHQADIAKTPEELQSHRENEARKRVAWYLYLKYGKPDIKGESYVQAKARKLAYPKPKIPLPAWEYSQCMIGDILNGVSS